MKHFVSRNSVSNEAIFNCSETQIKVLLSNFSTTGSGAVLIAGMYDFNFEKSSNLGLVCRMCSVLHKNYTIEKANQLSIPS